MGSTTRSLEEVCGRVRFWLCAKTRQGEPWRLASAALCTRQRGSFPAAGVSQARHIPLNFCIDFQDVFLGIFEIECPMAIDCYASSGAFVKYPCPSLDNCKLPSSQVNKIPWPVLVADVHLRRAIPVSPGLNRKFILTMLLSRLWVASISNADLGR